MKDCKHKKVYSPITLTSNPPQHPWVCKECGEEGIDMGEYIHNEYAEIKEKFRGKRPRR